MLGRSCAKSKKKNVGDNRVRKEEGIGKRKANMRLVMPMAFLTDARPNGDKFHDNKDGPGHKSCTVHDLSVNSFKE